MKIDPREAFPPLTRSLLKRIGVLAARRGMAAYLVGGIVRDVFLRRRNNVDLDIAVVGDGMIFARQLAQFLGAKLRLHGGFLTAKLEFPDGRRMDLATARKETYERPGALPRVSPATLADDLGRRDISINAMALALEPDDFGTLHDPFGGIGDIRRKIIRILHDRSLRDDPTRMVRMARFAARFGFLLERETERLLKEALAARVFDMISADRRRRELLLALGEEKPGRAVSLLEDWGILQALLPDIRLGPGMGQAMLKAKALLGRPGLPADVEPGELMLALLLSGTTRNSARRAALRLGLAGKTREVVEQTWRLKALQAKLKGLGRQSLFHRALAGIPLTIQFAALTLLKPGPTRRGLERYLFHGCRQKPPLTGDDLRRMGCIPGPGMKELLERLLVKRLDGELRDRRSAERFVRDYLDSGRASSLRRRLG